MVAATVVATTAANKTNRVFPGCGTHIFIRCGYDANSSDSGYVRFDLQTEYQNGGGSRMPREARLFTSSAGSVLRGYLKFRANIPPRWIKNARGSRKRIEPEIAEVFRSLKRLRIRRPRARVRIRNAQQELRSVLNRWETAYRKENFYRGIRILLELQRDGSSNL